MNSTPEKIRIRFTTHGSNPVVGNIWPGKESTLNAATAKRMVSFGHAEFIDEVADATPTPSEDEAPETETDGTAETEEQESDEAGDDLESLSVKKLKKLAKEENIDLDGVTAQADIIAAIRAARVLRAE